MCNPTSQPPRRDLYELETTMRTGNGPFSLPASKPKPPRLGSLEWVHAGPTKPAVFNAAYEIDGPLQEIDEEPWTVIDLDGDWHHFHTHPEAFTYALSTVPAEEEKEVA